MSTQTQDLSLIEENFLGLAYLLSYRYSLPEVKEETIPFWESFCFSLGIAPSEERVEKINSASKKFFEVVDGHLFFIEQSVGEEFFQKHRQQSNQAYLRLVSYRENIWFLKRVDREVVRKPIIWKI